MYRGIMTPSMLCTWFFGASMVALAPKVYLTQGWLHAKLCLVALLSVYHLACGRFRRKLLQNPHYKTHTYWRAFNEIPVFILVAVVFLAVLKPF